MPLRSILSGTLLMILLSSSLFQLKAQRTFTVAKEVTLVPSPPRLINLDTVARKMGLDFAMNKVCIDSTGAWWNQKRNNYAFHVDSSGKVLNIRPIPPTDPAVDAALQKYLPQLRFYPGYTLVPDTSATFGWRQIAREDSVAIRLPDFRWPAFQDYIFLKNLVQAQLYKDHRGECIDGKIKVWVQIDNDYKVVAHKVDESTDPRLTTALLLQLPKLNKKFYRGAGWSSGLRPAMWCPIEMSYRSPFCK